MRPRAAHKQKSSRYLRFVARAGMVQEGARVVHPEIEIALKVAPFEPGSFIADIAMIVQHHADAGLFVDLEVASQPGGGPVWASRLELLLVRCDKLTPGKQIRTVQPPLVLLSSATSPPCASTAHFTIERPKPAPPDSRHRALSTR